MCIPVALLIPPLHIKFKRSDFTVRSVHNIFFGIKKVIKEANPRISLIAVPMEEGGVTMLINLADTDMKMNIANRQRSDYLVGKEFLFHLVSRSEGGSIP
jgi:hypothetical protein